MESTTNGHQTVSGRIRFARTEPHCRSKNRSSLPSEYDAFSESIHRELDPRSTLERLVTDHVVHSAWKLNANLEKQAARDRSDKTDPDAGSSKVRIRSTELDRASRSLREALESLEYLRAHARPSPRSSFLDREVETELLSNEWPIVPSEQSDELFEGPETSQEEVPSWQGRLVFDFDISDVSPVVKGTWITVSHVVSIIVDGWSWADILRSHPELTEEDIRTCVAYAMAEENSVA